MPPGTPSDTPDAASVDQGPRPVVDVGAVRAAMAAGWWPAVQVRPLGNGHIHQTWRVSAGPGHPPLVVQRLARAVFADPVAMTRKVAAVIAHLDAGRRAGRLVPAVPALVATRAGQLTHQSEDGTCWRAFRCIEPARTLETLARPAQAEAAGRAFGALQAALADFPGAVPDPIPGFMQLGHYLERLDRALASNPSEGALPRVQALLRVIHARRDLADAFSARDRLVHADCKVNNLLFHPDQDDVVIAALDLDTVMLGHWAWDAGDLLRSASAGAPVLHPARGGGPRWRVPPPDIERFAAVVRGMRATAGITAAPDEWLRAPLYVTVMLTARFLTDHLEGDWYFRVSARGDNLDRAEAQCALLQGFEQVAPALQAAIA